MNSRRSAAVVDGARAEGRAVLVGYLPVGFPDVEASIAAARAMVEGGVDVDGVESWLYSDSEVTIDTLTSVLVAEGIVTLDDLCSGNTRKRCATLGLR